MKRQDIELSLVVLFLFGLVFVLVVYVLPYLAGVLACTASGVHRDISICLN